MKRKLTGLVALLAILTMTACSKEYTCDCSTTLILSNGGVVSGGETYTTKYKTKADADAACQAQEDGLNSEENKTASCVSTQN